MYVAWWKIHELSLEILNRGIADFQFQILVYLYSMANLAPYKLFVYGSLRRGFENPMHEYINRFFQFAGEAKVKGQLFDMKEYPAGIPSGENFIIGELYAADNENEFFWAIAQLDDYEGVTIEQGEKQLYRREIVEVHYNGEVVQAWIYWFNGDTAGAPVIASGDMMEYLKNKK